MTNLEREIRQWILKALLRAKGPMPEETLKESIKGAFPHVTFTDGDLKDHLAETEEFSLIAGTVDPVMGKVWDLTPKGKIKAQQLR